LLGTGGALINAFPLLRESFMVLYGDSYLPTDYRNVVRAFDNCDAPALMCVYHNKNNWDQSNVKIDGDMVVFYSKKTGNENLEYIDYGLSVYKKSVIERYLNESPPLDLAEIQEDLVARREMAAFVVAERFYEIGKPSGWSELQEYLDRS
jgi:NDP-sugar pyrophosphorylase family protein